MDGQIEQMMMMEMRRQGNGRNQCFSDEPIPTWKLYENPFYNYSEHPPSPFHQKHLQYHHQLGNRQLHRLHLPISTRKIAASFWDLTFIRPLLMESEVELSRAQITKLKAELELERRAHKKLEASNRKLGREVCRERRGREKLERVCEELLQERAQMSGMKREMEEEIRMLRRAEGMREERVQMKLGEAKVVLEERMLELLDLEAKRRVEASSASSNAKAKCGATTTPCSHHSSFYAINLPQNPDIIRPVKGSKDVLNFPKWRDRSH